MLLFCRFSCKENPMNRGLVQQFIDVSVILMVPFAPHTMDHIWKNLLKKVRCRQTYLLVCSLPSPRPLRAVDD